MCNSEMDLGLEASKYKKSEIRYCFKNRVSARRIGGVFFR